ncbi:LysR family transcriptional regulator [Alloalcanivorax xenomutans]|uniref:LysR family transcriptional regulator n=1 Tax=Alloalcanivorax xenomutans TaxID=1094342 RepID=UPI0035A97EE2
MELRHLRYFIAVAEELHFSRAAERLNIEQSPLSRTIKQLETELEATLLERTSRGTRLTWAGEVFLEDARRTLLCIDQAKANVKAAATGFRGTLRIALSDGIARSRLTPLLALCREEEPDVEIRLFEIPLAQHQRGLRHDLYDAGFAFSNDVDDGLIAEVAWKEPLVIAVPKRHPLLAHKYVPLAEVVKHPLVLCHPEFCEGCSRQLESLLASIDSPITVAERVSTHDLMLTLVAAGYGIGFSSAARIESSHHTDIIIRPLAGHSHVMTTYLLRPDTEPSDQLNNFMQRVARIGL